MMAGADVVAGAEVLASLPGLDAATEERLRERLAAAAAGAGVLDVAYRVVDSPFGALLLAATERGLVRVAFDRQGHEQVLASLAGSISPRVLRAPARLEAAARQLGEYFERRRVGFELPLDFQLARGFRRGVLARLVEIGYGQTASYAAVAAAAGSPRAVRAVGTACALNPLPLVVPCHRVVRSDGGVGQYAGGAEVKRSLLALEAAGPLAG
jgi:methylated-DNA-[protein]-cysteine S-methyltransferase